MFLPVETRTNFPQMEQRIARRWKKQRIFQQSVEMREGSPRFTMYEGPPTANGSPGIHHVLARAFKDVMCRYKAMKGLYVPRKAGWDTHGLPVELEVERTLGFTSKSQIEDYGIAQFNKLCKESVFRYLKDWEELTDRIAFWVDMEHPYITLDNSYIESCWWITKRLWDKGLIYRGYRVTPHCPRCGTSLSSHEVALGYKENAEDPSAYIKFRLDPSSVSSSSTIYSLAADPAVQTFILAWTTTPWTLPGNTALAVAPSVEYAVVETTVDDRKQRLILAQALLSSSLTDDYRILTTVSGSELVGLHYHPLYPPIEAGLELQQFQRGRRGRASLIRWELAPGEELTYPVIEGDFVSTENGTGVVHIAPAFGDVDFESGQEQGLLFLQPVDLRGIISDPQAKWPFSGRFVKDADPLVLDDLRSRELLYRSERIRHTYPFCWRCDDPLLYYAKRTWYIRTTAKKDKLVSGNETINWYPEHIKYGRFGDWLENNVDWAFSRERYWGTPLNIWHCTQCGEQECLGGLTDLEGRPGIEGLEQPLDLHRPYVDRITFSCQCGGVMERVPDVIDCWFDSGAMPIAQWHYPFENEDIFGVSFPADYICEAVDQTRGWFYSLHAISTMLFEQPCFLNVICLGHILDAEGEKMSKARGNVVDPFATLEKYSADALRWYLFTSSTAGNVRRFSEAGLAESLRKFLLTLWNTYSFFVTYANIDHFDPTSTPTPQLKSELDRWVLSSLNQLIVNVERDMENYDPTGAGRRIETFVESLSNWYVRRSRRRFWKSENDADKLAAHHTLHHCLVTLSKLLAPFVPFMAEEMYQNLVVSIDRAAPSSVHLADFPIADTAAIDSDLTAATNLAMKLASLGRAARAKSGIKVRQPLHHALVRVGSNYERKLLESVSSQVQEEVNVKTVEYSEELEKPGYSSAVDADYGAAVPTEISPELKAEGMAREIVHRLQTMRRSAGFDIADRIMTFYKGPDYFQQVMTDFAAYIKQETLSDDLIPDIPTDGPHVESLKLSGYDVTLGVQRM